MKGHSEVAVVRCLLYLTVCLCVPEISISAVCLQTYTTDISECAFASRISKHVQPDILVMGLVSSLMWRSLAFAAEGLDEKLTQFRFASLYMGQVSVCNIFMPLDSGENVIK